MSVVKISFVKGRFTGRLETGENDGFHKNWGVLNRFGAKFGGVAEVMIIS
jgi:hypothetical protein